MSILDKKQMTEEDIKLNFITPALVSKGWKDKITMETKVKFTDGKINIKGNVVVRGQAKKADYVLYMAKDYPIAIVEAKDNNHLVSFGMQQAKQYAEMLGVSFAYSSNGDGFAEYDFITGEERIIGLDEFPTPDELFERYKAELNGGKGITPAQETVIHQPFYTSQNTYAPRYYQRNAVNNTLDAIARGQKRILIAMATGTGKTYTAFQIVYRLLKSGLKQKVLYLADQNNLVDQTISGDFKPLEKVIHKINFSKDDRTTITSHQVYFSLYQQLVGNKRQEDESEEETVARFSKLFAPDFFDLVIVDECHRGSAREDSRWRKILDYFSSSTQIGMTATPKETTYVSNIDYFGKPVYTYSLKEGIDDGFLAPFKVINIKTNIGDEWRPFYGQLDYYGNPIEDRIYNNRDYDYNIVIQDRIDSVAHEITQYLKATDRMAKTIVFCATEEAAERMRLALVRENADMCKQNPDYIVRITGSDEYGKGKLDYFISVSAQYPVIATTSKLLTTGADCKMVKLIAIDKMIGSMTEFKQVIGRGTRIREAEGKTHFSIMDFRGVSRLFADPDWDGPLEVDSDYPKKKSAGPKDTPPVDPSDDPPAVPPTEKPYVTKDGCSVVVTQKIVAVYDTNGKLLRQESIIDYTKTNVYGDYATLDDFIQGWSQEDKKREIREQFRSKGIDLEIVKAQEGMSDVDDFDFICHIAYNQKPLTRKERVENVKKRNIFAKYGDAARAVLEALLDKYAEEGVYEIENIDVLKLSPFDKFGKPSRIAQLFGGKEGYLLAVKELAQEIYRTVA